MKKKTNSNHNNNRKMSSTLKRRRSNSSCSSSTASPALLFGRELRGRRRLSDSKWWGWQGLEKQQQTHESDKCWLRYVECLRPRKLLLSGYIETHGGNVVEAPPPPSTPSVSTSTSRTGVRNENGEPLDKVFCAVWHSYSKALIGTKCGRLRLLQPMKAEEKRPVYISLPSATHNSPCAAGGGIHGLSINPTQTYMVTAGLKSNPESVGLLKLPCLTPLDASGPEHRDWVFSVRWVSSNRFVSGSRDGSLVLWKVNDEEHKLVPLYKRERAHQGTESAYGKVRDCEAFVQDGIARHVLTLSPHAANHERVKSWRLTPSGLVLDSTFYPPQTQSWRNMSTSLGLHNRDENLFCFGMAEKLHLCDLRANKIVQNMNGIDNQEGPPRSLSLRDNYLTCGGATGMVFFYDLRKPEEPIRCSYTAPSTIFTHVWDEYGTSLLVAGGSLCYNSRSSFATVLM